MKLETFKKRVEKEYSLIPKISKPQQVKFEIAEPFYSAFIKVSWGCIIFQTKEHSSKVQKVELTRSEIALMNELVFDESLEKPLCQNPDKPCIYKSYKTTKGFLCLRNPPPIVCIK